MMHTLTSQAVAFKLFDASVGKTGNPQSFFLDREYVCPSREWFFGQFAKDLKRSLFENNLHIWKHNSWDCNSFALFGILMARLAHVASDKYKEFAPAVGLFIYQPDGQVDLHAVDFGLLWTPNKGIELGFMDIQTTKELNLSLKEREGCTGFFV